VTNNEQLIKNLRDEIVILRQRIAKLEGRQPPWFNAGDRVWYEPTPTLRFAGIWKSNGTIAGCGCVMLAGEYWAWKARLFAGEKRRTAPAIANEHLFWRASRIEGFDDAE